MTQSYDAISPKFLSIRKNIAKIFVNLELPTLASVSFIFERYLKTNRGYKS